MEVFDDAKIIDTQYYPTSSAEGIAGFQADLARHVLTVEFKLRGVRFVEINAGPEFKFSEAVSFSVSCRDQVEINYYWEKLSAHPENEQCGWCKDKFGLSWQIVPENMDELKRKLGTYARMMQMHKLVIDEF